MKNFAQVPLAKIVPDEELPTDIFIKISDKFIKFKSGGDELSGEKLNLFLAKNIKFLYVEKSNFPLFIKWISDAKSKIVQTLVDRVGLENQELALASLDMKESIVEIFSDESLTTKHILDIESKTTAFIEKTKKFKTSQQVLANLCLFNSSIANHSINVANLSIFLAMAIGQGHQYVLENLYLGALLHDYAKAKINTEILKNPEDAQYLKVLHAHPTDAVNLMRKAKKMPEPVFMIVEQHEENFDGSGYPKGLKKDAIYGLTRILSFCNIFENTVTKYKASMKKNEPLHLAYEQTLNEIQLLCGRKIDPETCNKAICIFKKTLGIKTTSCR